MASNRELAILPEPPRPGFFATCPTCKRRFSLQLESTVADEKIGELRTYACKHCGERITFADRHPNGCI